MVSGEDLTDAQPGFDSRTGEPDVNFRFNLRGGQRFGQVTSDNVGRPFAIVLDNVVISAPRILGPITGGSGQITGNFTVEQANKLAVLLRSGALPAKLTTVEERTVGPGLGQDSIDAGKRAALVGGVLVVVYMLATYGVFGVFADLALAVHILFIFASMVLLGATLTLPGIAGIVFTIGMAVDSNVLIYERIREENHLGRSVISSLEAGFQPRLRDDHRFQRDDVRGGADPLSVRLRRGARLRGVAGPRHSHLDHHRGDDDAHDDRAVVPPQPAAEAADMSAAPCSDKTMKLLRLAPENTKISFMRFRRMSYPLSAVALDLRRRAVPRRRHELRHRLRRRHAGRTARPIRQRRSRQPARQGRHARPRPGRGAAHRRATPT